ncbi:MAG: hydantoinase B/oxoprolinase family protein [Pirellulaceae bacterium]
MRPEFWIDVGGTFTDCLLRGVHATLRRCKVLSSGKIQGSVAPQSTAERIFDPARSDDPVDVWRGYRLLLLDEAGSVERECHVQAFDPHAACFELVEPLDPPPQPGQIYLLDGNEEAPLVAIRYLLGLSRNEAIPEVDVRLGTTRGTNALLTRGGAAVGLVITQGFADILEIGYQNRPHLFRLDIHKPTTLVQQTVEAIERLDAEGAVIEPLDIEDLRPKLRALFRNGIRSLAVCLLHGYRNPQHERQVRDLAREIGFTSISLSHEVAPLIKIVARGDTTVVDAYLNPVLRNYVHNIGSALGAGSRLRLLTSAGGLVSAESFSGKDSILSGPAGGVVGFSAAAKRAGFAKAIGFDMGGTSTDVSRFDGDYPRQYETEKAGVRIVAPMMAIETVAAGGGSICRFDGVKLVVGPESAGAEPGPACYGRGGPLCVTDVNFALGKLQATRFPFALDGAAVERRLAEVRRDVEHTTGGRLSIREIAEGFLKIANANIAEAIRTISVAKGYDPRDHLLVPFGGAAGQHACAVADQLGIRQLLLHPDAGILSAVGIGAAETSHFATRGVYQVWEDAQDKLAIWLDQLRDEAGRGVIAEEIPQDRIQYQEHVELRYLGLEASISLPAQPLETLVERYHQEHRRRYGYDRVGKRVEVVAIRVEAVGKTSEQETCSVRAEHHCAEREGSVPVWFAQAEVSTPWYQRNKLSAGAVIEGPALIAEPHATTVIDPGWSAEMLSGGELLVTRTSEIDQGATHLEGGIDQPDPVLLEIVNNQFAAIAEQMGVALRNTSVSVNVKERLDFSCAVFTGTGDLIANAPHIPVHLGAMGETVKATIQTHPVMRPGDVFVTNDPYRGGSHLPDVTVITPLFTAGDTPSFFTASRAHHAEIGGIAAGSMPSGSTNLAEEGVLIENFKLFDAGNPRWNEFEAILGGGPYPSRNISDNLADVSAQIAANHHGISELQKLITGYGLVPLQAYAGHIQDAAAHKTRAALARLPQGVHRFTDHLDDGSPISVAITVRGDAAEIDFTGTGPVHPGNLNCNRAIVTAAVMYCLRCLLDEEIPLNQGVLEPVSIHIPECLLNPPRKTSPQERAAVAGGNVETSQRIVDVLLGALNLAAASQGTMNNLSFGDQSFGYYETICGGAGATPQGPGASAVHTHMTNTRLTDPEVFELRFPARIREFRIRRGSGGAGEYCGGDGVQRVIEMLRPLQVSLLTQRRGPYSPYGLAGGQAGALGENLLRRASGEEIDLPGITSLSVQPGDQLVIRTPGGGGWGKPLS